MRLHKRPCPHCKNLFFGKRALKYCGDKCRNEVAKEQRAAYERRVKRPPHLYRKRKVSENQLELALDSTRT